MGSKNVYERFVWFDYEVRAGRHPNAGRLAERFEISAKTAQRDIEFMRDRLDAPLHYDMGLRGYRYSDLTFVLPAVFISPREISSLLIARKFLKDIRESYVGEELSSAVEKITSVLKRNIGDTAPVEGILSFQLIEYTPAPESVVRDVLEACLRKRRLSFRYYSASSNEQMERVVDPYHLMNYMGTWHLLGYCHTRQDIRNFHLARVSDVKVLDDTFSVRAGFDVLDYVTSSFGLYKGAVKEWVTLRFNPEKARWIRGQVWHRDQQAKDLADGSLELTFPVASYSEIMREILKHGSGVEVISPPDLRDMIKEEAKRIVDLY